MRAAVTVEAHGCWGPGQYGGGLWLYLPGRMLRVWVSLDTGYGSHWGWWRTRLPGDGLTGINWRGGPRSLPLTVLAHTRRIRKEEGWMRAFIKILFGQCCTGGLSQITCCCPSTCHCKCSGSTCS